MKKRLLTVVALVAAQLGLVAARVLADPVITLPWPRP